MLQTEYVIERDKVSLSIFMRSAGTTFWFRPNRQERFSIMLTSENFTAFRREIMELGIYKKNPNFSRDFASLAGVKSSGNLPNLKLLITRSETRSGWLDLKIDDEIRTYLKFALRANELQNIIDETIRLFLK